MNDTTFNPEDDEPQGSRRNLVVAGSAVGAVALLGVAFLALSGGGSDNSSGGFPKPHTAAPGGAATASPSAATPSATLDITTVSQSNPFQVPTRILQALAPPPASPTPSAGASPVTGTTPGETPISSASTAPSVQFLQLLGAKKSGTSWVVTVRTNQGTCTGVKEGAAKVCGTDFSFGGADSQSGQQTFVFVFGEVQGGNLVPDAKQKATPVKAGNSALVAVNGKVDGGIG